MLKDRLQVLRNEEGVDCHAANLHEAEEDVDDPEAQFIFLKIGLRFWLEKFIFA